MRPGKTMRVGTVRGVLLDIDGTLLDSNVAHALAWVDALTEARVEVNLARTRPLVGKGGDKVLQQLAGIDHESERGKAITHRRKAIFEERYFPDCRPFPMARELAQRLRADALRVLVATSASKSELHELLRAAGVHDLIEDAATSSDATRSKPDPDIVQAAVERSGLPPEELLMLGDTPYDVEAARRARVDAVALRSGGWPDADLDGAAAVYRRRRAPRALR
jgi:HAD superfamily hydrolase (TIGR01509 family)